MPDCFSRMLPAVGNTAFGCQVQDEIGIHFHENFPEPLAVEQVGLVKAADVGKLVGFE